MKNVPKIDEKTHSITKKLSILINTQKIIVLIQDLQIG